jgi:hypothetical protein
MEFAKRSFLSVIFGVEGNFCRGIFEVEIFLGSNPIRLK